MAKQKPYAVFLTDSGKLADPITDDPVCQCDSLAQAESAAADKNATAKELGLTEPCTYVAAPNPKA